MQTKRGYKSMYWLAPILICTALYLLIFPKMCSKAMTSALKLSVHTVVPAVFPYLVLSGTFVGSGLADRMGRFMEYFTRRLFGLPGCCGGVIILGIFCGFPVGAKMAGMLYQQGSISKPEAERLLAFSDFCGPSYIFSVVGAGLLQSFSVGVIIFLVQTMLSLLMGILLAGKKGGGDLAYIPYKSVGFMDAFTDSVKNACLGTLQICGYVSFFAVFMSAFSPFLSSIPQNLGALFYGFFEMSGGILRLPTGSASLLPATAILFWSGLSVFMQVGSAVSAENTKKLSLRLYLLVRLVTVPFGTAIVYFLCRIFGLIE